MRGGHVFVLQGDLMQLACDAWLVPGGYRPGKTWRPALVHHDEVEVPPDWGERSADRVMPWPAARSGAADVGRGAAFAGPSVPEPYLTYLAGTDRHPVEWHVDAARAFVRFASARVKARPPYHGRACHLLALPLVGTGDGGASHVAGDVVRKLLPALREEAAASEVDLALVVRDGPAFAAAQGERLLAEDQAFAALPPEQRAAADALAERARAGDLVVFLGAGVSLAAGLPSWHGLLADLARERAQIAEIEAFGRLGELDRAAILARRLGRDGAPDGDLGAVVAEHLRARSTHYALGHGLLASLPVDEVVTTNYDELFERASAAVGRPASVLPAGQAARGERWLLKMHGCVSRPESIVLTREDYLRFQENRSALAGIVQALLITRHMLFVGFSFSDDNFHRIAHSVRTALRQGGGLAGRARFGTTLVVNPNPLARELWHEDLEWLAFDRDAAGAPSPLSTPEQARRVDIFLDRVAARAPTSTAHLCDRRYEAVLSPAERDLRGRLEQLVASAGPEVRRTPAWAEVERLLRRLGATGR